METSKVKNLIVTTSVFCIVNVTINKISMMAIIDLAFIALMILINMNLGIIYLKK
jgi:hypothetical protein